MIPKLVIFDLDGTLAESKQPLTDEMATLLSKLIEHTQIAVISGGALPQFLKQMVSRLPHETNLAHLHILPTSGAALYEHRGNDWEKIYEERLSEKDAHTIETAMRTTAQESGLIDFSTSVWGERIEYRGGDVTMSALGQRAPIAEKKTWDPDHTKRKILREKIAERLPEFLVSIGGSTSIDVTKHGIDKAYGVRKLCERLRIKESDALYIGDELESDGNDAAVYKTDAQIKSVKNTKDTAHLIQEMLTAASAARGG